MTQLPSGRRKIPEVSGAAQVTLSGVDKIFERPAAAGGPVHAVGPIDLQLRSGEFFSVVGPSGCGKSTLARIAGGAGEADARRGAV